MRSLPVARLSGIGLLALAAALSPVAAHAAGGGDVAEQGITHQLVTAQKLPNVPGDSLTAVVVDLAPGALSPSHRHPGFVFAYVLSGTLHTLTQNPSAAEPASLLAVWVAPDGAELVVPPDGK